jgi:ribulose 1,5-bisphosphate synthetase/thiazole synthase
MRYSGFRVIAEALTGHKGWKPVWRDPAPKAEYDYIIVGGGGHGLATAYYLAKEFRQARIAVLEKGYLGGGNVGATPRSSARTTCWTATSRSTNSA